jgi:hypothetical protein
LPRRCGAIFPHWAFVKTKQTMQSSGKRSLNQCPRTV